MEITMRKTSEQPARIEKKIFSEVEGFDLHLDIVRGTLKDRAGKYTMPVKEIESDQEGKRKFVDLFGKIIYFHQTSKPAIPFGTQLTNHIVWDSKELDFMAMDENSAFRMMFKSVPVLQAMREACDNEAIVLRLEHTEHVAYRSDRDTKRIKNYSHPKFSSEHALKIAELAKEQQEKEEAEKKAEKAKKDAEKAEAKRVKEEKLAAEKAEREALREERKKAREEKEKEAAERKAKREAERMEKKKAEQEAKAKNQLVINPVPAAVEIPPVENGTKMPSGKVVAYQYDADAEEKEENTEMAE